MPERATDERTYREGNFPEIPYLITLTGFPLSLSLSFPNGKKKSYDSIRIVLITTV